MPLEFLNVLCKKDRAGGISSNSDTLTSETVYLIWHFPCTLKSLRSTCQSGRTEWAEPPLERPTFRLHVFPIRNNIGDLLINQCNVTLHWLNIILRISENSQAHY